MKPLKIFRHAAHEGPGYLEDVLQREKIPYSLVCIDQDESFSTTVDDVSGLVFMGGPMSVNDDLPWIEAELALIRNAIAAGLPVLGHCLGGQLMAKALGAVVKKNPVREIGWHEVQKVQSHALTADLPELFLAFHWHGETFDLPAGATLLLGNKHCAHQAFAYRNCLALQCHVEMTDELVTTWVEHNISELNGPPSVQSAEDILEDLERRCGLLQRNADMIYRAWLQGLTK